MSTFLTDDSRASLNAATRRHDYAALDRQRLRTASKQRLRTARAWWFVICLIGFTVLAYTDWQHTSQAREDAAKTAPRNEYIPGTVEFNAHAITTAQSFVADTLLTPASASFHTLQAHVFADTKQADIYVVKGTVDSQNAFGAMLRQPYHVTMRKLCFESTYRRYASDCWEPRLVQVGRQVTKYKSAR